MSLLISSINSVDEPRLIVLLGSDAIFAVVFFPSDYCFLNLPLGIGNVSVHVFVFPRTIFCDSVGTITISSKYFAIPPSSMNSLLFFDLMLLKFWSSCISTELFGHLVYFAHVVCIFAFFFGLARYIFQVLLVLVFALFITLSYFFQLFLAFLPFPFFRLRLWICTFL